MRYSLALYLMLLGIVALVTLPEVLTMFHALHALGTALQAPANP